MAEPETHQPAETAEAGPPASSSANDSSAPKRSFIPWLVAAVAVAFALGLIGSPQFEHAFRGSMPEALRSQPDADTTTRVAALESRVSQLEKAPPAASAPVSGPAGDVAVLSSRVEALERVDGKLQDFDTGLSARITQLSDQLAAQSASASQSGKQARDLLLVAMARRFVETGRPLGRLQDAIAARFLPGEQAAVDALAAWSAAPQSAALLRRRLGEFNSHDTEENPPANAGWWDRLKFRLSRMVRVTDDRQGSEKALELVQAALDSGDVAMAVTQMESLPPSARRDAWLEDARRLSAALAAVDALEGRVLDSTLTDLSEPAQPAADAPANVAPPVNAPQG